MRAVNVELPIEISCDMWAWIMDSISRALASDIKRVALSEAIAITTGDEESTKDSIEYLKDDLRIRRKFVLELRDAVNRWWDRVDPGLRSMEETFHENEVDEYKRTHPMDEDGKS